MNTSAKQFAALHREGEMLLLGNAWNVQSAKVLEKLGYRAIGTSSAAVAETLGFRDGQYMPFPAYRYLVERICACTDLPLSVDLEGGYGETPEAIADNILQLSKLGVAGINIEDSEVNTSGRKIADADHFARKLEAIITLLHEQHADIFINVRCDAFLLGLPHARGEALDRVTRYEKAGADGIFLPCIVDANDIRAVVSHTHLPVNVMCMPQLTDLAQLRAAGVRRVSMGNFLNQALYREMEVMAGNVIAEQCLSGLFAKK